MNVLEKILEEIEKLEGTHMGYWRNIFRDGFIHGIGECKKIIRSHMDDAKDTNIPSNDGWIPVDDRLPEQRVDVLVDFGDDSPVIAWYSAVNKTWKNSSTDIVIRNTIIAWQPLPKPYKPKKDITASGEEHIMSRFMKAE